MKRGKLWMVISLMLGLAWAALTQAGEAVWVVAPLWWIGNGLRSLSLSGSGGNVLAWGIVLVAAALPLLFLVVGRKRGKAIDWLLPVISIQIGSLLYFLVNPTLANYPGGLPMEDGFALIYSWSLVASIVGYILLRILERVKDDSNGGRFLPKLLCFSGLIYVGLSAYSHLATLLIRIQTVTDGNTGDVFFTVAVLTALAACQLIPEILGGKTLLWSGDVATGLMTNPFGEDTIDLCNFVAKRCHFVAFFSICVGIAVNLVQILLVSSLFPGENALFQANIQLDLPLLPILLSSALHLVCSQTQRAKELADDNNSII